MEKFVSRCGLLVVVVGDVDVNGTLNGDGDED
jgi:hypothetical protein